MEIKEDHQNHSQALHSISRHQPKSLENILISYATNKYIQDCEIRAEPSFDYQMLNANLIEKILSYLINNHYAICIRYLDPQIEWFKLPKETTQSTVFIVEKLIALDENKFATISRENDSNKKKLEFFSIHLDTCVHLTDSNIGFCSLNSPNDQKLLIFGEYNIAVFNGNNLKYQTNTKHAILDLAFNDTYICCAHHNGKVSILDAQTGNLILRKEANAQQISIFQDNKIITSNNDGIIKIWKLDNLELKCLHSHKINHLAVYPIKGKILVLQDSPMNIEIEHNDNPIKPKALLLNIPTFEKSHEFELEYYEEDINIDQKNGMLFLKDNFGPEGFSNLVILDHTGKKIRTFSINAESSQYKPFSHFDITKDSRTIFLYNSKSIFRITFDLTNLEELFEAIKNQATPSSINLDDVEKNEIKSS